MTAKISGPVVPLFGFELILDFSEEVDVYDTLAIFTDAETEEEIHVTASDFDMFYVHYYSSGQSVGTYISIHPTLQAWKQYYVTIPIGSVAFVESDEVYVGQREPISILVDGKLLVYVVNCDVDGDTMVRINLSFVCS